MADEKKTAPVTVVKVGSPEKIGEKINAYVRYTVTVKTTNPKFNQQEFTVHRRFREFHALYEKLVDDYRPSGYLIPHPPEKSLTAMTKVKVTNQNTESILSIDKRTNELEKYINRIVAHPVLSEDPHVIAFLQDLVCTLKGRDRFIKFANSVTTTFGKLLTEADDYDSWFEEKVLQIETLEANLKHIQNACNMVHRSHVEIAENCKKFSIMAMALCSTESNDSIANALTHLSEMKEKYAEVIGKQGSVELHELVCTVTSQLNDIISVKHLFEEYIKSHHTIKTLNLKVSQREESITKFEMSGRSDKVILIKQQIDEFKKQIIQNTDNLQKFYANMKSDIERFETTRVKVTRDSVIEYVKGLVVMQEQVSSLWEEFIPHCESIA